MSGFLEKIIVKMALLTSIFSNFQNFPYTYNQNNVLTYQENSFVINNFRQEMQYIKKSTSFSRKFIN